jgi:hypothetical protein
VHFLTHRCNDAVLHADEFGLDVAESALDQDRGHVFGLRLRLKPFPDALVLSAVLCFIGTNFIADVALDLLTLFN